MWFFPSGGPGLGTWEPRRGVILYGNLRTKHVLLNSGPNFGPKPGPKIDSKPGPKLIQKRDPKLIQKRDPELIQNRDPKLTQKRDPKLTQNRDPNSTQKRDRGAKAPRTLSGFWGGFFYNIVPATSKTHVGKSAAHHQEKIEKTTATKFFILFWRTKMPHREQKNILFWVTFFWQFGTPHPTRRKRF